MIHDNDWYEETNRIHPTAVIYDNVVLGKNNIIMPYAVIGAPGFVRNCYNHEGKIYIGDNNIIGCFVNIMVGVDGETKIGNDNMIMSHSNIGHNVIIGNDNEIGAGTLIGGHADIGDSNKIKLHCSIRNRVKIRDNNLIGMGSNVVSDVGHYFKIMGNPAEGKQEKWQ